MGEPGTKHEVLSLEELEAAGGMRTGRKHVLTILVENRPGVLTRIAGLFARRGFNIDTLTVGPTDDDQLSRITLTVDGGSSRCSRSRPTAASAPRSCRCARSSAGASST